MSDKIIILFLLILLSFFIVNIDCQTNIVDFNGRKFQFNGTKRNIDSHNASCSNNGMQFALLKSEEEINFIIKNKIRDKNKIGYLAVKSLKHRRRFQCTKPQVIAPCFEYNSFPV